MKTNVYNPFETRLYEIIEGHKTLNFSDKKLKRREKVVMVIEYFLELMLEKEYSMGWSKERLMFEIDWYSPVNDEEIHLVCDEQEFRFFLTEVAIKFGVPKLEAKYYVFSNALWKQWVVSYSLYL
jgi:hypothetical protein